MDHFLPAVKRIQYHDENVQKDVKKLPNNYTFLIHGFRIQPMLRHEYRAGHAVRYF